MAADEPASGAGVTRRSVMQLTGAALALPAAPVEPKNLENWRVAFTPKFVDLVRNTTTTTGTGNFVLGPAVNGFTSFAAAIQPGESFYYSAIGIEKPDEREVGRGTLQPNGSIKREAIDGALTSFTSGTKTVALVAAAEWYEQMQAGGSGAVAAGTMAAATRVALAASTERSLPTFLQERGREGVFVFDAANLSAEVATDPIQGVHVAPASDPTGASGAWVRKYSGPVDIRWFGGKADGVSDTSTGATVGAYGATDNSVALNAAIAFLAANRVTSGTNLYYRGGAHVHFPAADGVYDFQSAINLKSTVRITGDGSGQTGGTATVLRWRAGVHGIIVNTHNTNGAATVSPSSYGADGSVIEGLYFVQHSTGNNPAADDHHALWMRARATVRDCGFKGWSGNGVHVVAGAGGGGSVEGNANYFHIERCYFTGNEHGLFIDGGDANAGLCIGCDFSSNRGYGLWDSSFLGNTHVGHHAQDNGLAYLNADGASSRCWYGGAIYHAVPGQSLATRRSIQPGTNPAVWSYLEAAGSASAMLHPQWTAGNMTNWRDGGAYCLDSSGAFGGLMLNCYAEGGQGGNYGLSPWRAIHGNFYYGWYGGITWDRATAGFLKSNTATQVELGSGGSAYLGSAFGQVGEIFAYADAARTGSDQVYFGPGGTMEAHGHYHDLVFSKGHPALNAHAFRVTTPNTRQTFGRATAQPLKLQADELAIGNRFHSSGTAAPTSGAHARGEIVWNESASAGGVLGWVCTASGTPGTWVPIPLQGSAAMTAQSGTAYTAVLGDADSYIQFSNSSPVSFTLPPESSVAFPVGTVIEIEQAGAGAVGVVAGPGVTINSRGATLTLAGQYAVAALKKVAADTWTLTGDL